MDDSCFACFSGICKRHQGAWELMFWTVFLAVLAALAAWSVLRLVGRILWGLL